MRMSGSWAYRTYTWNNSFYVRMIQGQRIVARLRESTYEAAMRQEVEFIEKGEGDVLSRLSVDSSIVGERCVHSSLRM